MDEANEGNGIDGRRWENKICKAINNNLHDLSLWQQQGIA